MILIQDSYATKLLNSRTGLNFGLVRSESNTTLEPHCQLVDLDEFPLDEEHQAGDYTTLSPFASERDIAVMCHGFLSLSSVVFPRLEERNKKQPE